MENQDSNNNFWISYADLMAGLLFVFILLIGAIIAKYSLLQNESKILEQTLKKEKIALENNKKELSRKELKIQNTALDLAYSKEVLKNIKTLLKDSLVEREQLKLQRDSFSLNVDELKQNAKDKESKLDKLLEYVLEK
jgi:chemotaxis protein MotB